MEPLHTFLEYEAAKRLIYSLQEKQKFVGVLDDHEFKELWQLIMRVEEYFSEQLKNKQNGKTE